MIHGKNGPALWLTRALLGLLALGLLAGGALFVIPNGYERAGWRLQVWWTQIRQSVLAAPEVLPTPQSVAHNATPLILPTLTPTLSPTAAPEASPVPPTPTRPPLPAQFELTGFTQVWQKINNCGPATLAMGLSYWGWKGTQANTATALKPDPNDRNVSPEELAAYARQAGLSAQIRVGGSLELLKRLVSSGFPVLLEKSVMLPDGGWEGHYTLATGYSDLLGRVTTQDSLQGPNFPVTYADLVSQWRSFNYLYLILYPSTREAEVVAILDTEADPAANAQHAIELARQEITTLAGTDLAFAWFNLGTNLTALNQSAEAAEAYDQARVAQLPWRMTWYQFGPYIAYYNAGRFDEVIALADAALGQANNLEESLYWRGRARWALGDTDGAVSDWRLAVQFNRNYAAPQQALAEAGQAP